MPKTGFSNGFANVPGQKYYKYHGWVRECNIEPVLPPYGEYETVEGPYPIFEKELKITTIYQCGEVGQVPNLYAPLGYRTCDPNFVLADDVQYLYTKTTFGAGNGQAVYNKESFLDKLRHKVVAIQGVEVHMKGEVFIHKPGVHYNCGPDKGKLYVTCTYTEDNWQSICLSPGTVYELAYEWKKCKPRYVPARNWGMEYLEEYAKIGFRVDQCTETDPADWGKNKTRCYYNYCIVKYKNSLVVSLGFDDLGSDIGPTWAFLYGRIEGGGNGYFKRGFQYWKKATPGVKMEKTYTVSVYTDYQKYLGYITGLDPLTIYNYRALLRNTGIGKDTIYGRVKGFTTKA